jgi:hypothetical protein
LVRLDLVGVVLADPNRVEHSVLAFSERSAFSGEDIEVSDEAARRLRRS